MMIVPGSAAANAPRFTSASPQALPLQRLSDAAHLLLPHLERGNRIDAMALRVAMERAYGGSDAAGAWDWKAG